MKISIIIPAYNEEKRIRKTLEEYASYFRKKTGREIENFEILVVLNACRDNTLKIVEECRNKFSEINYINFEQGGKGLAIIEGFRRSIKKDFDLIGFVDADMATSPDAFFNMINKIGNYDGIIASRYIKGAIIKPKRTLRRYLASRMFNFIIRTTIGLKFKDTQCGAKLFRRTAIEGVIEDIGTTKWAFDVDLIYKIKKKGMKIKEIPTEWHDKEYSKINLGRAGPQMFLAIIRLRILGSPLKNLVKIYDFIPKKYRKKIIR